MDKPPKNPLEIIADFLGREDETRPAATILPFRQAADREAQLDAEFALLDNMSTKDIRKKLIASGMSKAELDKGLRETLEMVEKFKVAPKHDPS